MSKRREIPGEKTADNYYKWGSDEANSIVNKPITMSNHRSSQEMVEKSAHFK